MTILTVSQLNFYIKSVFDSDDNLHSVLLSGEISNFTDHYSSGHLYMSLKDDKSVIKAVMFAGKASRLRFRPENGMKVLVRGSVSVYDKSGQYQVYIDDMQPDGAGALSVAFEQLKRRLAASGIFAPEHKKPIPAHPARIGVITSPTGAAVQDILRILKRRYPIGEVVFCPVQVQGESAAGQLTEAVRRFDRLMCADVIIIGRGGGSAEDLWAFNDEQLARAIYDCRIPIVSGVGHETDFTICDFAADARASTPSAAAELVTPEEGALEAETDYYRDKLKGLIRSRLSNERLRLDSLARARVLRSPDEMINIRKMQLDQLSSLLCRSYSGLVSEKRSRIAALSSKLDALSPLRVLSRGYAVAVKDGHAVSSVEELRINDSLTLRFSDGSAECSITERKPD